MSTKADEWRREAGIPRDGREGRSEPQDQPITAAELMEMEFPPATMVVEDVLPEGVSLLAGKPKKGKSWMAAGMCIRRQRGRSVRYQTGRAGRHPLPRAGGQ